MASCKSYKINCLQAQSVRRLLNAKILLYWLLEIGGDHAEWIAERGNYIKLPDNIVSPHKVYID